MSGEITAQITAFYAALIGLLLIFLSVKVIRQRLNKKIGIGDNGDSDIARAIRVQANLVEYAPIALLLLFFCENSGMDPRLVHTFGIVLVIARIAHATGLSKSAGTSKARVVGTLGTFLTIFLLATFNIVGFFI